jgi:hypothetical protein
MTIGLFYATFLLVPALRAAIYLWLQVMTRNLALELAEAFLVLVVALVVKERHNRFARPAPV